MMMFSFFGFFGILLYLTYDSFQGAATLDILGVTLAEVYRSFFLFLIYLLFWIIGYFLAVKRRKTREGSFLASGKRFSLRAGATFLVGFAIVFLAAYLLNPSIDNQFRSSLTSGAYGKFFFVLMTVTLGYFGTISAEILERYRSAFIKTSGSTLTGLIWLIGFLIISYVLFRMGGRGRLISLLVLLGAARHYLVRPITMLQFFALTASALALAIILPVLTGAKDNIGSSVFEKLWGIESGRTFDGLYNFTVITNWWSNNGAWGFPGQLWIGDVLGDLGIKGVTNTRDVVMKTIYGKSEYFAGFPATKPGEFLLNFGIMGVPAGGLFLGYIAGKLYITTIVKRAFGAVSIPIYIIVSMRLGVMSPAGYFGQNIVLSTVAFFSLLAIWATFFGAYRLKRPLS